MGTQHTPEPWRQSTRNPDIVYAGNIRIAKCCADIAYTKEEEANARRIAAAVNACAGIETETLEAAHLNQTIQNMILEKKQLQAENERLKQSHKELLGFIAHVASNNTKNIKPD